jgi:hypothetical protein
MDRTHTEFSISIPLTAFLAIAFLFTACDRIESPEDRWYDRLGSGQLIALPFSHDLEVLGYQGWRFMGKLPRAATKADIVQFRIWYDVTAGEVEPEPVLSHRPADGTALGAWAVDSTLGRRVEVDVLLAKSMESGTPAYICRTRVNGREITQTLELPKAFRHEVTLSPPEAKQKLPIGESVRLATAHIGSWSGGDAGKTATFRRERSFTWFLELDLASGE